MSESTWSEERICPWCGGKFTVTRETRNKRYCQRTCVNAARNATHVEKCEHVEAFSGSPFHFEEGDEA